MCGVGGSVLVGREGEGKCSGGRMRGWNGRACGRSV